MRRVLALLAGLALALLPTGCIEGEETTWLERDGSGRLEARYSMPDALMSRFGGAEMLATTLEEAAARDPHVELTHVAHRSERRGRVVFEFAGTFDDLRHFCTFPQRQLRDPDRSDEPVEAEVLFGETILDIGPRGISVHRTIDISKVLPRSFQAAPGMLGDSQFRYILHLPVAASETNAPVISSNQRTLEWSFLLRDHTDTPMVLTAEAPLPWPGWIWPAAIAAGVVLLGGAVFAVRRGRRRRGRSG